MNTIILVGLLIVGVLGGVAGYLYIRDRDEGETDDDPLDDTGARPSAGDPEMTTDTLDADGEDGAGDTWDWLADAERVGTSVGTRLAPIGRGAAFLLATLAAISGTIAVAFLRKLPLGRGKIGDTLVVAGMNIKKGGSDVICNVIYGDGVVMSRPATWNSEELVFETTNDEKFSARGIGFSPKRLAGKVPVVWALRASNEVTEPLEAAIANARQQGRFKQFTRKSGESDIAVDIDPNGYEYGPGVGRPSEAVTDGGVTAQRTRRRVDPYEGQIISYRDAYELFGSKVTQEDQKNQETRGKLAVLDWERGNQWKWALLIIAAFALGLFGPAIAGNIAGGASSGMGGGLGFGLTLFPWG